MRQFRVGSLQKTILGDSQFMIQSFKKLTSRPIPNRILEEAVQSLFKSTIFTTLGGKYLQAYLKLTNYKSRESITDHDFLIFAITLRRELPVTTKTLKRYLQEAWQVLQTAGFQATNPRNSGTFSIIHKMGVPEGKITRCKLDYCSIRWSYVKLWKEELRYPTRLDKVGLAIVAIAYTTMRRVGTFIPGSIRAAEEFS